MGSVMTVAWEPCIFPKGLDGFRVCVLNHAAGSLV